jgi:drug/metabolite transporter (DMT)-like permease
MNTKRWITKDEQKGAVLILASTVAFCLMSGLVRYASNIDPYKTTLFRFIVGLGMLGTAALLGRITLKFVNGPLLLLRGLTGGAAILIFFFSISKLGVGKGTVLIYSFPIFGSIFSSIFLKERIGAVRLGAILMAFAGIYLLAADNGENHSLLGTLGAYELLAILGAMLGGVALVAVKKLHDTDSSYAIFFAQCAMGLWIVVAPANIVPCSIGISGGLLLVAIGVASAVGQLLSTEGYRYVQVATGSLLGMTVPVLNYFLGVVAFDEAVSWRSVVGSAAVLGSCAVVLLKNNGSREEEQWNSCTHPE